MKKFLLTTILLYASNLSAQPDSALAKWGKLDFAIPDHPAFSILNNNTDNILRPGNSNELFSLIYANFLNGKTPVIPKDLSVEFAPVQLSGMNTITYADYKKNGKRILYDCKLSIGGKTSEDGDTLQNFAIGLRTTWVDKTALSANQEFVDSVCKALKLSARDEHGFILSLINEGQLYNGKSFNEDDVAADNGLRDFVDSLYNLNRENFKDARFFSIKELRDQYKKKTWNKFKFETAIAFKFSSADSIVRNGYLSKFQLYNTLAVPLGKSGQWLIGINVSSERRDSVKITVVDSVNTIMDPVKYQNTIGTLAMRFYVGSNNFKSFIETSLKNGSDKLLNIGLNIGTEINLADGLWGAINLGNNWMKSTDSNIAGNKWLNNFFWHIDIRFHLPEKKKI